MIILYQKEFDILQIKEEKKIKSGIRVGPFILDFSFDNKVIGIEILGASEILNMKEKDLSSIRDAKIKNIIRQDAILIIIKLLMKKQDVQKEIPIAIPLKVWDDEMNSIQDNLNFFIDENLDKFSDRWLP